MKTRTKQCGVFAALTAVLLLSAALVISCVEPISLGGFTVPQEKGQTPFVPPEGMGCVSLNIGGGDARTIRPASGDFIASATAFEKFDVSFTAVSPGTGTTVPVNGIIATDDPDPVATAYQNLTGRSFTLTAGQYNVEIWAYEDEDDTAKTGAVAYGKSTTVTVVAGTTSNSVSIDLKEISTTTHGGTGTFAWALTPGDNTDEVLLTLTTYPDGDEVTGFTEEDITSNLSGTAALAPGFYRVSVALSGTNTKNQTITEILHIYQGMTSTYSGTLPDLGINVYTITYTLGYTSTWTPDTGATFIHGSKIIEPTEPTRDGYVFEGWFNESGTTSAFDFDKYYIRNQIMYAKWVANTAPYTVTITFNPHKGENAPDISLHNDTDNEAIVGLTYTIDRDDPIVITFSVDTPATGAYSNYSWTVAGDGNEDYVSTTSSIALDFKELALKVAGPVRVNVEAIWTLLDYTEPVNNWVEITVDD